MQSLAWKLGYNVLIYRVKAEGINNSAGVRKIYVPITAAAPYPEDQK